MLYLRFKNHLKGIDRKSFFLGDEIIICVCVRDKGNKRCNKYRGSGDKQNINVMTIK